MILDEFSPSRARRTLSAGTRMLRALRLDGPLTGVLALIICIGVLVVYSASGQNVRMVERQLGNIVIAVAAMIALARFSTPQYLRLFAPLAYALGILLLIVVDVTGHVGKGAQRWLDLGFMRFQPSEIMKLAVPMICAWYMHERPLPPTFQDLTVMAVFIAIPTALVVAQPDLGTALLIAASGLIVMLLAGLQLPIILLSIPLLGLAAWGGWHFVHAYQRERILTFLNPQSDRLGAGYHIIQSQIAIGSGGVFGKGYMHGSQAQLDFLPESSTDFIFSVIGEEFGLLGQLLVLGLYAFVIGRSIYLALQGQDTFSRLTGGAIALGFFVYVFVNAGMVSGIVPVVGVPLP
ncbi:MAG TPA: rod shape-determining protein RodA, partial [Steroidobacteraceae bacterium]|nr:rod shape-determining protein RodA [Steroidobacteraceae bacterium]